MINKRIGLNKSFDAFMVFCAERLIFVFLGFIIIWLFLSRDEDLFEFIFTMGTGILASLLFNWVVALFMRRPRPIVEFPTIHQLVKPIQTFKSFPSDHTAIAFTLALIVLFIGAGVLTGTFLLVMAMLIAVSRIYVGVHYPRDILGGVIMGILISSVSIWLTRTVSIPIFVTFFG